MNVATNKSTHIQVERKARRTWRARTLWAILCKLEYEMIRYNLTLYSKSEKLDLNTKKEQITEVLSILETDQKKAVSDANLISISKCSIIIEVEESGKYWHQSFGKILKNKFNMHNFCNPKNSNRMFKWQKI